MPHEIRIDNFHGSLHVHPPQNRDRPPPTAERPSEAARGAVRRRAEAHGTIHFAGLLGALR